jgi:hypothetical protein
MTQQVTADVLADAAVTEDKLATGAVTAAKLNVTAVTGQTDETAPAATDTFLLQKGGALKEAALNAIPGTWQLINTYTPAAAAQQDITGFDSTKYSQYRVTIEDIAPATDNVELYLRASINGGSSFLAAGEYEHSRLQNQASSVTASGLGAATANQISIANAMGNQANETGTAEITIIPKGVRCFVMFSIVWISNTPAHAQAQGGGYVNGANVNALRVLFSSGNIASGTIRFYGLRK